MIKHRYFSVSFFLGRTVFQTFITLLLHIGLANQGAHVCILDMNLRGQIPTLDNTDNISFIP